MANPFCHIELHASDQPRARQFYSELFDWKLNDMEFGGQPYTMIEGKPTGGMMAGPVPGAPSHWLAYVEVPDVTKATEKATKLGATVLQPKTEIPNHGWFTIIADPTGAALGLVQH